MSGDRFPEWARERADAHRRQHALYLAEDSADLEAVKNGWRPIVAVDKFPGGEWLRYAHECHPLDIPIQQIATISVEYPGGPPGLDWDQVRPPGAPSSGSPAEFWAGAVTIQVARPARYGLISIVMKTGQRHQIAETHHRLPLVFEALVYAQKHLRALEVG